MKERETVMLMKAARVVWCVVTTTVRSLANSIIRRMIAVNGLNGLDGVSGDNAPEHVEEELEDAQGPVQMVEVALELVQKEALVIVKNVLELLKLYQEGL